MTSPLKNRKRKTAVQGSSSPHGQIVGGRGRLDKLKPGNGLSADAGRGPSTDKLLAQLASRAGKRPWSKPITRG